MRDGLLLARVPEDAETEALDLTCYPITHTCERGQPALGHMDALVIQPHGHHFVIGCRRVDFFVVRPPDGDTCVFLQDGVPSCQGAEVGHPICVVEAALYNGSIMDPSSSPFCPACCA